MYVPHIKKMGVLVLARIQVFRRQGLMASSPKYFEISSPQKLDFHHSEVMHQSFETPASPHSGLSGAFTFYRSLRSPGTTVSGAFPRP